MRIWLDTEFIEDGKTIDLISIGMIREDGATYYAEAAECDRSRADAWVKDNVFPHLSPCTIKPRAVIAKEIVAFAGDAPEFWAYYADYDWVALCQLYGRMIDLPKGWPMFCRDLKQLAVEHGNPTLPEQDGAEHDALADARWNKRVWEFLTGLRMTTTEQKLVPVEPDDAQRRAGGDYVLDNARNFDNGHARDRRVAIGVCMGRESFATGIYRAMLAAAPAAPAPEDAAEHFVQAAIDSAPEPLRRLGEWLANKLDDDDWKTADRLVTGAAVALARAAPPAPVAASAGEPTARSALQAIANLPLPSTPEGQNAQEDAYRAVEALFELPPHIECNRSLTPNPVADNPAGETIVNAPRVRELRWNEYEREGDIDQWDAEAGKFHVYYGVELHHDGYRTFWDGEAFGPFDTLEAAKSAAQADYERRVLACLVDAPVAAELSDDRVKAAVTFAQRVSLSDRYSWADYMQDLWGVMTGRFPAAPGEGK